MTAGARPVGSSAGEGAAGVTDVAGSPPSEEVETCESAPIVLLSPMRVSSCVWGVDMAATLALVCPSAPRSTKLISPSVERRTTSTGPENSRPLTSAVWLGLMNSNSSTDAAKEACHGKPLRAEATISRAATVSRETTPVAKSLPASIWIASVWPTPLCMS